MALGMTSRLRDSGDSDCPMCKRLGGTAKVQFLRHCNAGSDVAQIHCGPEKPEPNMAETRLGCRRESGAQCRSTSLPMYPVALEHFP